MDGYFFASGEVIAQVTTCTPTIRMLVLEATAFEDTDKHGKVWQTSHNVFPVVALQTKLIKNFTRKYPRGDSRPKTDYNSEEQFTSNQFEASGNYTVSDVIYLDTASGYMCSTTDSNEYAVDCIYQVIHATWPQEEDGQKLKRILADLEREVLSQCKNEEDAKKRTSGPSFNPPLIANGPIMGSSMIANSHSSSGSIP